MPQSPAQVDALQIEPGSGDSLLIERDATNGDMKFTDPAQPAGVFLSDLAGFRAIGSVIAVAKSGAGAEYTTVQAALDAVLATSSLLDPTLIMIGPGVYTEDLTIEKDGVFLVGMGGVTLTAASADATIKIQAGVTTTPRTIHLENLRITNTGSGEECILITGGAGSEVGDGEIRLINCDLVAGGVGTYNLRATSANNIRVFGGTWSESTSTALALVDQCASLVLRDVEEVTALQLSYNSGGVLPSILTSQYAVEDCGVVGNVLTSFTGLGSLILANCPSVGTVTQGGDRPSEITSSRLSTLTLNGTASATLLGSSYTSFAGAGTLQVWDGEKFVEPGLPLFQEQFRPGQLLVTSDPDWAVAAAAATTTDPVLTAMPVLAFDDTVEEGVGFLLSVPSNATQITFRFKGRASAAPGAISAVGLNLYVRRVPDNAVVPAWSVVVALTPVSIPTSTNFQYDSETLTLAGAGLLADNLYMFQITRDTAVGSNLAGDWLLSELGVEFT